MRTTMILGLLLIPALTLAKPVHAQGATIGLAWDTYTQNQQAPATALQLQRTLLTNNICGAYADLGAALPITSTATNDATVVVNQGYCYRLAAVAGTQRAYSNEVKGGVYLPASPVNLRLQ